MSTEATTARLEVAVTQFVDTFWGPRPEFRMIGDQHDDGSATVQIVRMLDDGTVICVAVGEGITRYRALGSLMESIAGAVLAEAE